jgi:hypothetical protein
MEFSATDFDELKDDACGGATGIVNNARQRRQRRLMGNGLSANRRSHQTISEYQSMDWHDKLALSAAATADTALISIETPETPSDSVRVRKMPSTPATHETLSTFESEPFPDIVMTTRTFPHSDTSSSQIPMRLKMKNSRIDAFDSLPIPPKLPRGQQFESRSGERQRREGVCHEKSMPMIPRARLLTPSVDERFPKPKSRGLASRPKPNFQRYSSAPTPASPSRETNVLDHVLMDRALLIRQNLISFEMQELAEEAEKAAESGLDRFVGSASKFGVEETPPYRPEFADDGESLLSREGDELRTPLRSRKFFVDNLTNRIEYTPSYFNRKKIPVTSLRNFSDVIPKFCEMHNNIRIHLGSEGVDTDMLPELHTRRSLMLNDTDDTEKEFYDDVLSLSPSVAESLTSFSSYAVASLNSLRDIIEYVQRPTSSLTNISRDNMDVTNDAQQSGLLKKSHHSVDEKDGTTTLPRVSPHVNSDSDDSSVEYYGRKSPLDVSSQSVTSNVNERSEWIPSLSQSSRSNISGKIKQTVLQRRIKSATDHTVTFENEKVTYQALLDRMQNSPGNRARKAPFDVDQNSCAPSLATLEIFPSRSATSTRANIASPVADFLTKLQNQFSLTTDDAHHTPSIDEDHKHFVTNYFYSMQNSSAADPNSDLPTLNLEINPEQRKDSNFLRGCGSNNCLSACVTATKYADRIFDWFTVGEDPKAEKSRSIIDPNSQMEQSSKSKWRNSWQTSEREDKICRRDVFVPPKLSVRHTAGEKP